MQSSFPSKFGIRVRIEDLTDPPNAIRQVIDALDAADLVSQIEFTHEEDEQGKWLRLRLSDTALKQWAPGFNTLELCKTLKLDTINQPNDLQREIVVALLLEPSVFDFPSFDELVSSIRIRHNIVQAARKTALAFHTEVAERPTSSWVYREGCGFTLSPGVPLIDALKEATQPGADGTLFDFSCYRATEYIILMAIAQELERVNPELLQKIEDFWHQRAIMSGEFHDVFLHEQGSMDNPLPASYFVPGDRTWFRNPDAESADVTGFEGSWVVYLGGGLFANFWKPHQHYTMIYKCLEIFHWRHSTFKNAMGELCMDESVVEQLIEQTEKDPAEVARILALMMRYREPRGVYTDAGGCIDTTREFARWVHPGTSDLVLPGG